MLVTSLKRSASSPLCDCIVLIFTSYRSLRQQAARLVSTGQGLADLNHFEIDIDTFEEQLDELLTKAIDLYFKR